MITTKLVDNKLVPVYKCSQCGVELPKNYGYCDRCIGRYSTEDGPQAEYFNDEY